MSGTTIQLFSRRNFDFSDLTTDGQLTLQVVKAIDVSQYTSGTVEVRVHSSNIGSGATIYVRAYTTAPTPEDPSSDFVNTSATVASVAITSSPSAPGLAVDALESNFGGMLTIAVEGDQPAGGAVNLQAELSALLTLKS